MSLSIDKSLNCHENINQRFSLWLKQEIQSMKTGDAVNVPCGECTACCTSSYFIHIKPHEMNTISKIPRKLMFPAPGMPEGNLLLGYDKNGNCPMFINNRCSIYEYRPQTCRTYDCRIFAATGLPVEDDRELIYRKTRQWEFDLSGKEDAMTFKAVRTAAAFFKEHRDCFPAGFIPVSTPQQAMLAVLVYEVFLNLPYREGKDENNNLTREIAGKIIEIYEKFERGE